MRPKFSNYTGVRCSCYWCQKSKSFVYGAKLNISFLLQLIFAALIVEEKIYDLKRLYLRCLVVLLREVTTHMLNRLRDLVFLIIRKRSSLCGFDFDRNPEKGWGNEKKVHEQKAEFVYLRLREKKNNSFEISVIILGYIRNVDLSYSKRILKLQNFLKKASFFLYITGRPKN